MPASWRDFDPGTTEATLATWLAAHPTQTLGVRGLPNGRLSEAAAALTRLRGDSTVPSDATTDSLDLERLWTLGEAGGRQVTITWSASGNPLLVDAVFAAPGDPPWQPPPPGVGPDDTPSNDPVSPGSIAWWCRKLERALRQELPKHLWPDAITLVDDLP
jgi:hypothetical protein